MKKKTIILVVLCLVILLFLPRYLIERGQEKKLAKGAAKTEQLSVKVMKLKADQKPISIVLPSYLEAIHATPIWARTSGYLINYFVDIGDRVTHRQLLAEIDTPDVDEKVAQAAGELAAAIAKEEIAWITAERWRVLYRHNPESLSAEEVDRMSAAYESAAADKIAAEANLKFWEVEQDFKFIYAPFDGVITMRKEIDIGTLITEGSADNPIQLFQIAKTDILRAFVDVPQSLFYLIEDGIPAEATIWEYPGKSFKGVIDRNAGALDPKSRTLLTQVNLDNKSGELMPGLYAQVRFQFAPKEKTYIIPVGALVIRSGPPYVAVVADNQIHMHQVEIGIDTGKTIQIISGLAEGDQIVIQPSDRIQDGVTVTPIHISKEEQQMLMSQ